MTIEEIQRQIDATDYWDAKIYDVQASFFCDEIIMLMECDSENLWEFKFEVCNAVQYYTDASARKKKLFVREMNLKQMGYYGHSIEVKNSNIDSFLHFDINLSSLNIAIECMYFTVSKVLKKGVHSWWENNI